MKETTSVSISGVAFILDSECYALLKSYLRQTENSLYGNSEAYRIQADIETSIAEQILSVQSADFPVPMKVLAPIIDQLGGVQEPQPAPVQGRISRRMYRNPERAMIGGVCSGLGTYFGIDVAFIRILFLLPLFLSITFSFITPFWHFMNFPASFNGTAILLYLILWIAIPKARNPRQWLEMQGDSVTASGIAAQSFPNALPSTINSVATVLAKGIALFFGGISLLWGIGMLIAMFTAIFYTNSTFNEYSMILFDRININPGLAFAVCGSLVALPAFAFAYLLISIGFSWVRGRRAVMVTILIIWIVLFIVAAVATLGNLETIAHYFDTIDDIHPWYDHI